MLRSLEQYGGNIRISIYGDEKPEWLQNVRFVEVERYYPKKALDHWHIPKFENWFDTLNKHKVVVDDPDIGEDIVWMYDDIYLTEEADFEKVIALRYIDNIDEIRLNKWGQTIRESIPEGGYVYETHLPKWYKKDKLYDMIHKYPISELQIPYAPATRYYNTYYDKPDINLQYGNSVKASFLGRQIYPGEYESDTDEQVERAVKHKSYLNHNDNGLTTPLKNWLLNRFPNKSKYESSDIHV